MTLTDAPNIFYRFPSGMAQVRAILDQTQEEVYAANIDPATNDTTQIILGEVLNNVVEHAYGFEEGHPIEVSIWLRDDGLMCKVLDRGAPMPNGVPPDGALPIVDATARDTLPEGGFGWAMVRDLTRELRYFRTDASNELFFLIPAMHSQN